MNSPTMEDVDKANRFQICGWYRFLPTGQVSKEIMDRICERLKELGGFTPEISKRLGW